MGVYIIPIPLSLAAAYILVLYILVSLSLLLIVSKFKALKFLVGKNENMTLLGILSAVVTFLISVELWNLYHFPPI